MNSKRVLIVDDDQFLVSALKERFEKIGFLTSTAYDGNEALEKVSKDSPDLILLDLIMPGMDGVSVLKKLKSDNKTKDIPIVILTNLVDDSLASQIKEQGGSGYFLKNEHNFDAVIEAVKNLI